MSACICATGPEDYEGYQLKGEHKPECPFGQWERENASTQSITVSQLANKIHRLRHRGLEHLLIHSCPCIAVARWYLGLDDEPKVFWPAEDGSNAWTPSPSAEQ